MLAYVSWHRPAQDVGASRYEQALERFHRSLAQRSPSGFRGSGTFRAAELPWLAAAAESSASAHGTTAPSGAADDSQPPAGGYEDWYLLDSWSALGVLEEAAISRGHSSAHDAVASKAEISLAGVYRLSEGHACLADTRVAVWVKRPRGHDSPALADLLGDGIEPERTGLWRRCVGLGPAPEYCLLGCEPSAGVAATRLPAGWHAQAGQRQLIWAAP
ncbi:MAG TPA: hypothetical protein VLJ42_05635 [Solirubrobacteraceae bacterium]|nr:hypothetical protein [Solirubrobacteraceae bacterium]